MSFFFAETTKGKKQKITKNAEVYKLVSGPSIYIYIYICFFIIWSKYVAQHN